MGKETKELDITGLGSYSVCISDDITTLAEEWDAHCGTNIYTASNYLGLLEECGPIGYNYYYVLIKKDGLVKGLVYCQHKTVNLDEDYRAHTHSDKLWDKLKVKVTKFLFRMVKHEMLICGNVILTGEYGIRIESGDDAEMNIVMPDILDAVRDYIKEHKNKRIQSTLLKDFYLEGPLKKQSFDSKVFTGFQVQPDMILTVDDDWSSYDDYLGAVKSKYRVKFKKVKKKGADLSYREMDLNMAKQYNSEMYGMYKNTADRSTFSMFVLDKNYFARIKEELADNIILTGVFLDEKLVAFFTYVKNGDLGDAHFLGYNVSLNNKYQIYFNILLLLVETAILNKAKYLNLSRTALEIKSSVGARPYDMKVYLQYHRSWINKHMPYLLSKFVPENEWLPRNPFK